MAKCSTLLPLCAAVAALAVACGTSDNREQSSADNAANASPTASPSQQSQSTIVLEVTGSGEVYSVYSIPFGQVAGDHATMPFSKSYPLAADVNHVSLTWTSRDDAAKGCKITVDNIVVVEKPLGTTEDCVFER